MNRSNQTQATDSLRFMRCGIGEETYGLDMSWVRSIQRVDRLHHNPEAVGSSTDQTSKPAGPPEHSPVGWLSGEAGDIPVFSLASRLGRPPSFETWEDGASQRIVVLHPPTSLSQSEGAASLPFTSNGSGGCRPWALLADDVSRVTHIPADRLVPLPPLVVNPSADYFKGVIHLNGRLTLFLAPERLHPDSLPNASRPMREARRSDPTSSPSPSHWSGTTSAQGARRTRGQVLVCHTTEPNPVEHTLAFGLSISQVPEVLGPLPLTQVPGAAAFVLGLVNWRGRPVPVIDLGRRLGLAPSLTDGRTRLVIARDVGCPGESAWIGFPVRPAIRLLRLPVPHEPSSRSLSIDQTLIRGVVELEGETLVIPDIHNMMHINL